MYSFKMDTDTNNSVSTAFAFDTGITNNAIRKTNSGTAPLRVVFIVIPPYHLPDEKLSRSGPRAGDRVNCLNTRFICFLNNF